MITTHIRTYPPTCNNKSAHSSVSITMEEKKLGNRRAIQRDVVAGPDEQE
jgi:hypothetical protein